MNNDVLRIKATTLTPVTIRTGREYSPFEYMVEDGHVLRFLPSHLYSLLTDQEKNSFTKTLSSQNMCVIRNEIRRLALARRTDLKVLYRIRIAESFAAIYKPQIESIHKINDQNALHIGECARSLGGFYLPGSSLKGALRTALLYAIYAPQGSVPDKLDRDFEKNAFGYTSPFDDPFRDLIVTDSRPIPTEQIMVASLKRGRSKGIPTSSEVIDTGAEFEFEIRIRRKGALSKKHIVFSAKTIRDACNQYYQQRVLGRYESAIRDIRPDPNNPKKGEEHIQRLRDLLSLLHERVGSSLTDREWVMNIGFGGGAVNKFITPQIYDSINRKSKLVPETFWKVDSQPLGWIKCQLIEGTA